MTTLVFGLAFDSSVAPRPHQEVGYKYVGVHGLIKILETDLGLSGHIEKIQHIRIEQYRQAISQYLMEKATEGIFFKQSFETDALACAEALLAKRDELMLANWDFQTTAETPKRLSVFADLEKNVALISGYADRFVGILKAIPTQQLSFDTVLIHEPIHLLSPEWERLWNLLKAKNIKVSERVENNPNISQNDTDLATLQYFLKNNSKKPLFADGSLLLIEAERDTEAAHFFAQTFRQNPAFRPTILHETNDRVLDEALIRENLPSLGLPSSSLGRPTLQLLKLVTAFLWQPLDPFKVLEFVTLGTKPLADDLSLIIARLMSERPGVNGEAWFAAINEYFEKLEQSENTDLSPKKVKEQYDFWFNRTTYDISKSAPTDEIISIFGYLQRWASEEYEHLNSKNSSLLILSEQARRIKEFLETLPPSERFLSFLELERIVRTIYEPAPVQPTPTEVGALSYVNQSAAFLQQVRQVLWWNFAGSEAIHFFSRWYQNEIVYLTEKRGLKLDTPQRENALQLWQLQQPIFQTSERLILVVPKYIQGKSQVEHPLMSHLKACFGEKELHQITLPLLQKYLQTPEKVTLNNIQLGRPEAFISLSEPLAEREYETPTSLESLFYYPHQWVFNYKAKLNASPILSVSKDKTLMGNLAHRFFELALKSEEHRDWQTFDAIHQFVEEKARLLFNREGSVLMMYGREPERLQFLKTVKKSLWVFLQLIRNSGWEVWQVEKEMEQTFQHLDLRGKADVVLKRGNEIAVVDLKYSGLNYRHGLLKNREDLQLVMYSKLLLKESDWLHTAYFIIDKQEMIARNELAFQNIKSVDKTTNHIVINAEIWAKIEKTYAWRIAQLQNKQMEIRTEVTLQHLENKYGEELMEVLEMKKDASKYDNYQTLIKWRLQ